MRKNKHREYYTEHRIQERQVCGGTRKCSKKKHPDLQSINHQAPHACQARLSLHQSYRNPKTDTWMFRSEGIDDRYKNNLWPTHFAC